MQHYSQAPMQFINIAAQDYDLKQIRHMGYFRKGAEKIWDELIHTFDDLLAQKTDRD